jgi:hypothetical protein
MRTKAKRTIRPSGVEQTETLFYWKCTVSGLETFGDAKRFADVVKIYGSEEKLVQTYVLRPVKKYVEAGYTPDEIKQIIHDNDGKLPSLNADAPAKPTKKETKQEEKSVVVESVKVVETVIETPKERPVYIWQSDPNYFKGHPVPFDIKDETREKCIYPNHCLDSQCRDCPVYDLCISSVKYSPEDQMKPKRNEVKIKAQVVFS